jgi:hypothetical protein
MKTRLAFMIVALIFISCAHRELQLPESPPLSSTPSKVNIIRENQFFGFGFALEVIFDDAVICKLRAGEYITFLVQPGFHNLGLSESTITVPFAPNRKYYFLIKTIPNHFGFEIERIDNGIGNYLISNSKVFE